MHLIYVDDSADEVLGTFSALAVAADQWRAAFRIVKDFRHALKKSDGIYVHKEWHAWKFVSGRGNISERIVPKGRRCQIFKDALEMAAGLPGTRIFNAVFPKKADERAFEWLLNRINRTIQAWDSRAILICDEGKDAAYTRLARRMGVYNPIPSQFGTEARNIPIDRIIEDPFFKRSEMSYFIQLTDFCAYALLRRERPVASKSKYGLDQAFKLLDRILVK